MNYLGDWGKQFGASRPLIAHPTDQSRSPRRWVRALRVGGAARVERHLAFVRDLRQDQCGRRDGRDRARPGARVFQGNGGRYVESLEPD